MPSVRSTALPAATTAIDMIRIITLIIFSLCITANAASLKLITKQQKVLPNGNAYGLASGLYFELYNLEPYIMYKLQYSEDLVKWTDMVYLGTYQIAMTSPYWTWDELPPNNCFFRLVVAW
jgi:hypothetical protein